MKHILIFSAFSIAALAACDSPTPPSITAQHVQDVRATFDRIKDLPKTAEADLPPGSADFVGFAGGEVSGDAEGSILGDMTMNVDFGTNAITGGIDNVNLIDEDDIPEQLLGGTLTIVGTQTNGTLTATATGNLSAVGEESVRGSSNVTLGMSGDVLTDVANGDTVSGSLSGSGSGDFDVSVFNGAFYGTSQ